MGNHKNSQLSPIIAYFAGICLFSIIPAYYVWHSSTEYLFLGAFFVILFFSIIKQGTQKDKIRIGIFFSILLLIYAVRSQSNFNGYLAVICLFPIMFAKQEVLVQIYYAFTRIYAIFIAASIFVYLLVVILHLDLPHNSIEALNSLKSYNYSVYPFLVKPQFFVESFRFFGLFDEPGVVGTISGILLLIGRFELKKWENVVFLISGILSFSMFFFVVCGIYIVSIMRMKYKVFSIALILAAIFILRDNDYINEIVFMRFQLEDGKLLGDTRMHGDFANFYEQFRFTPEYFTGLGKGTGNIQNEGGSSYKQIIVDQGIIFFVLYIVCYLIFAKHTMKGWRSYGVYSICYFGTMYQRPFVIVPISVFLMLAGVYMISDNFEKKDNIE